MHAAGAQVRAPAEAGGGGLIARLRLGILLATLAGLAIAGWAIGRAGAAEVVHAVGRLGLGGFLLFCLWSLGQFVLLGAAWLTVAPGVAPGRIGLFAWARMVREAVSDLLPFSQLGGIVVSSQTVVAGGVPGALAAAALLADLVTEMASQLALTAIGLALMAPLLTDASGLRTPVFGGVALMIAVMGGFYAFQRHGGTLARRLAPAAMVAQLDEVEPARARVFADRPRITAAFVLNLLAWLATVGGAWLVLRLIGAPLPFARVLSLEVLIFTIRAIAFVIPGALGVQEAGYALAGPLFGLPVEAALALSLAKRARDLALGVPTLLVWQLGEARTLWRTSRRTLP